MPSMGVLLVALAIAVGLPAFACVYVTKAYTLTPAAGVALLVSGGGMGFAVGILVTLVGMRAWIRGVGRIARRRALPDRRDGHGEQRER